MPRRKKDPAYRRQREKNRPDRALVVIDGRRYHLGEYDDEESRRRYHELLAQWRAGELHPDDVDGDVPADLTIVELCARWQTHARTWYRLPDGTLSREAENFNPILKLLRENFGRLPVAEFRPKQFRVLRSLLIEQKNARTYINAQMRRVRQIVRWGVGQDLVDVRVLAKIETVEPLKRGRTEGVRETKPVKPVTIEDVEAVRPHVSRQVWAAIELQLLTGARPGEILKMRPCDIDTSAEVWFYAPDGHKNTHRGHERKIPIGPKAQAIIRPFLADRALTSPLLSPKEAEEERLAKANAERKTPLSCGNRPGNSTASEHTATR